MKYATFFIFAFICLVLLIGLSMMTKTEGFSSIPSATQSSFLPGDVPGATTSDPRKKQLETRDIINAKHTVEFFQDVADPEDADTQDLLLQAPILLQKLEAFMEDPEKNPLPSDIQAIVERFEKAGFDLKQKGPAEPFQTRYYNQASLEGFANANANANQTKTLEVAMKEFEDAYKTVDLTRIPTQNRNKVQSLYQGLESYRAMLQTPVSPNDTYFTSRIQMITSQFQEAASILTPYQGTMASVATLTTAGAPPNILTLTDLKALLRNIETEMVKLTNLRSTAPTMVARINQLTELSTAVRTYIRKVEQKQMDLRDIPISAEDARNFMKSVGTTDVIPPLIKPTGTTPASLVSERPRQAMGTSALPTSNVMGTMPTQAMFEALQKLKWSMEIKVDYDPMIAHRDSIMKRMEELEKRIAAYAYSETPMPPSVQRAFQTELAALSAAFTGKGVSTQTPWDTRFPATYQRGEKESSESVQSNTAMNWNASNSAQPTAASQSAWYNGGSTQNRDTEIRPGFMMTDDQIRHRASTSAFQDSVVGGLDYKQRALELCRQVGSANIVDDSKVLGCISQPDAVGPSYSWKGNYEMVCNRLGDGWGSWYPEMFGCPKYDPEARYKGNMM